DLAAELVSPLVDRGIDLIGGHVISAIKGGDRVEEIELSRLHGTSGGVSRTLDVDAIAVCGGWNPRLSPFVASGGEVSFDEQRLCLKPERGGPLDLVAGSATGNPGLAHAFETALSVAQRAIKDCGLRPDDALKAPGLEPAPRVTPALPFWHMPQGSKAAPQWVDLKADRTAQDAVQDDPETIMVSPAAHPQLQPAPPLVSLSEVELQIQKAVRQPRHLLPTHSWHTEAGAAFRLLQQWLRPAFYPQDEEAPEDTLKRERKAVREKAGMCDFSANGKVEVSGRDAASFLDKVYTAPVSKLEVGTLCEGFVLTEGGAVLEEGIIARLEKDRFYLTTSPGGGDRLVEWLETVRREDAAGAQLAIVPVTEHWATVLLSGPRARQVLLELKANVDVSTSALPHQHIISGDIGGAPARIFRTSPTGEVSFEICVPSGYGLPLWERLIAMGTHLGLTPIGEDTLAQLAAEKGRIPARQAIDNGLSPVDLGYEAKPFEEKDSFIGRRALLRPAGTAGSKLELVALRGETRDQVLPAGARVSFTTRENEQEEGSLGTVLIGFYSEPVNQAINLALVAGGASQQGAEVSVRPDGQEPVNARIIQIHTYDPGGRRPHG
ncbi:MAG: aminomethyltransferase family protein, partial [Alphaproteobacteria bacterium]|nr:aminomethyltransferase family protein [Alphaproteobacteria bacterium]